MSELDRKMRRLCADLAVKSGRPIPYATEDDLLQWSQDAERPELKEAAYKEYVKRMKREFKAGLWQIATAVVLLYLVVKLVKWAWYN